MRSPIHTGAFILLVALPACGSDTSAPPALHPLSVAVIGNGAGTVASSPSGIDCGETCQASFQAGSVLTLTAIPEEGSAFDGWSGAGCGESSSCTVTILEATTVSATFSLRSYVVTVERVGQGTGVIGSEPAGIECGSPCTGVFAHGTTLTLSALPDDGFSFTGWTGGGCPDLHPCEITLNGDLTLTAGFGALTVAWPDSHTRYCTGSDGMEAACPAGPAGQDGHYEIHVPVYTAVGGRVHDSVTGLTWERFPPYQPIDRPDAGEYCTQLDLDGFDDWRIPSLLELASLVDAGRRGPPFPAETFPGIPGNAYFWTRNGDPSDPTRSYTFNTNWAVSDFRDNADAEPFPGDTHIVRCVRGPGIVNGFSADGGTVFDAGTGLVWQSGAGGLMTWTDALAYCEALALDGAQEWRLPSIKEWFTNVDPTMEAFPRISIHFSERPEALADRRFWSSTPLPADHTDDVYAFDTGPGLSDDTGTPPEQLRNVRCVR